MSVWIPARLAASNGGHYCDWADAEGTRYDDPFFELTLTRMRRDRPVRQSSPVDELLTRGMAAPPARPAALIFHVSRCGSTLMSQLLVEDPRAAMLSEAPILDDVLRTARQDREQLFDAAVRLLALGAGAGARLFIKTDAWHACHAALLRRLYPDVPFVFLYRAPAAVLRSHARTRGSHMVPGLMAGVPIDVAYDPATKSLDQYGVEVLEIIYGAMLEASLSDAHTLLVSYDEGFPDAFFRAASWMGLTFDEAHRARIEERCRFHGKRPGEKFAGDAGAPMAGVDLSRLDAIHRRLEHARVSAIASQS